MFSGVQRFYPCDQLIILRNLKVLSKKIYKQRVQTLSPHYINRAQLFGDVSVLGKYNISTTIYNIRDILFETHNKTANPWAKCTQSFTYFRSMLQLSDISLVTWCYYRWNVKWKSRQKETASPVIVYYVANTCFTYDKNFLLCYTKIWDPRAMQRTRNNEGDRSRKLNNRRNFIKYLKIRRERLARKTRTKYCQKKQFTWIGRPANLWHSTHNTDNLNCFWISL